MGRKPNTLVMNHFTRGRKLPDSSNRYEHTCKHCGERFPKGRVDSLTNHLKMRCQGLTPEARADLEPNPVQQYNLEQLPEGMHLQVPMNGQSIQLPVGGQGAPWTGLNILAEVSKQMGENPDRDAQDDRSIHNRSVGAESRTPAPHAAKLELQESYTLDNPPVSYEQRVQRDKQTASYKASRHESEMSLQNYGQHVAQSRPESPNLAMAASSMAAAAVAASRFAPSMVDRIDPQLLGDDSSMQRQTPTPQKIIDQAFSEAESSYQQHFYSPGPEQQLSQVENQVQWVMPAMPMADTSNGNHFGEPATMDHGMSNGNSPRAKTYSQLAMNAPSMTTEFSAEYGNGQKSSRPKVRGRFTDDRRKEVQQVRKQGACVRCRMLKKPCSSGTPCDTCKGVEAARLWKGDCIRTRLAEQVSMYSAGLHAVLSARHVNQAKSQHDFRPSMRQLEAYHYAETGLHIPLHFLESSVSGMESNIDPGLGGSLDVDTVRMLDEDTDDLPAKIDSYAKIAMGEFIKHEPSNFMRVTLQTAHEIVSRKEDTVLQRTLELWAHVHMFFGQDATWKVSLRMDNDTPIGQGPTLNISNSSSAHTILYQLNAAAEKKASILCKNVLNDLERRLIAKSTDDAFATFLASIIILNCIEKSAWIFKSWEQESFKATWPLAQMPSEYTKQGDSLTEMLTQILGCRHIPPKTKARPHDDILVTENNDISPEATAYFERVNLKSEDVKNKQTNFTFEAANPRCYELRFCSHLLLPKRDSA